MNQNLCDLSGHCITCSDEAVPMQVNALLAGGEIAICQGEGGAQVEVLAGLQEGDQVVLPSQQAGTGSGRLRMPSL